MDFCIPEVPLDNRLQKERLQLVNKGSLSKRRKPSRYSCRPKHTENSSLGEHITNIQIQSPPPLININKRENRRRANSENCPNGSVPSLTDSRKITEIRKNAVLIQTWERRSQNDWKKVPEPLNGSVPNKVHHVTNGNAVFHPPKYHGKENRQSLKPVFAMPDALNACGNDRSGLRNKQGPCNGNMNRPATAKNPSIRSNRLVRPKSLCSINSTSSEEPEWISLSRKLCAKFVQSHLDSDTSHQKSEIQQNGFHCDKSKQLQHSPLQPKHPKVVKKTVVINPVVKNSVAQKVSDNTNGTSELPPWVDLSRKLCTKFIEEHIESKPPDPDPLKPVQKAQSPHPRIIEKIGRSSENLHTKSKKDEPEWVNLSRRLRAKFIEGHKDDPDTISLDNQLNASDLEEYSDVKYSTKTRKDSTPSKFEVSKSNGNCDIVPKDLFSPKNDNSTISFCYWSDIDPCTQEIQETNTRKNPSVSNCTKREQNSYKNADSMRSNIAFDCHRYSQKLNQEEIKKDSSTWKHTESLSNGYKMDNFKDFNQNNISNNYDVFFNDNTPSVDDDVNYELTFETFETACDENGLVSKQKLEADDYRTPDDIPNRSVSKLNGSKSLCDLSRCEPDSLEFDNVERNIDYESPSTVHDLPSVENNGLIRNAVSVIDLHQEYSNTNNSCDEILERSQSLTYVDSCCSPGIPQERLDDGQDNAINLNAEGTTSCEVSKHSTWRADQYTNSYECNGKIDTSLHFSEFHPEGFSTLSKDVVFDSSDVVFWENNSSEKTHYKPEIKDSNGMNGKTNGECEKYTKIKNNFSENSSSLQDPNSHRFFVSAVPENASESKCTNNESQNNKIEMKSKLNEEEIVNLVKSNFQPHVEKYQINSDKREIRRQKNLKKSDVEESSISNGMNHEKNNCINKGQNKIVEYSYLSPEQFRSIELTESHPGKNKTQCISDRINGKRESLKEFDIANESYQAINPPFEFEAFEIPSICSAENKRILMEYVEPYRDTSNRDYSEQKRIESSDSETPNSTPFDARTLVSPSSFTSESDTSSWTLAKSNSYGHNKTSVQDTDFSDCSMSVKCNDTPNCSNQSTMENRSKPQVEVPLRKNKSNLERFSEVFVDCETTKDWNKTRSLDQLDERASSKKESNHYVNLQPEMLESKESGIGKSSDKEDSIATMPESLRHLFNVPRTHIYTPTAKTSMLLSKSSEPLPCHYYSNTPVVPSSKKVNPKSKTERSSSVKIKDFAHGILLTFKKLQNQSKSSQISSTHYVDVSHLAETDINGRHKEFCPGSHPIRHGKDIQRLNATEYGKINRISAGYFGSRSTSESNLFRPSSLQICTCQDEPIKSPKKVVKEERPKSFNFGMISDSKSKTRKKTPEMKEKKSKPSHSKSRGKKIETRSNSSVSRKVEQMADGTLCLITTVSGDTAVPGVYSDSQDTASEMSSHAPVKLPGESNC